MLRSIQHLYHLYFSKHKESYRRFHRLLGFVPRNHHLYKQAFIHNSSAEKIGNLKTKVSNERLEYLGDAVLGLIVAELLFKKYPFKGEGFLTEMRSKLVSRKKLSEIAFKMGLNHHLALDSSVRKNNSAMRSIAGNALEALIGAVYLDRGYGFTKRFIKRKILVPYIDLEQLKEHNDNYKSVLNQWAQKERKKLEFKVKSEKGRNHSKLYTIAVVIQGTEVSEAEGKSKKSAEQLASEIACKELGLLN